MKTLPPFRIRFDDPFKEPHKRAGYIDFAKFNPIIDEGPINRSALLRRERLAEESTRYKRKK